MAETFAAKGWWFLHSSIASVLVRNANLRLLSSLVESESAFGHSVRLVPIPVRFGKHWKSFL